MDQKLEFGMWMHKEARLSYKYWHSSANLRINMANPFFDRTQCEYILKLYPTKEQGNVA